MQKTIINNIEIVTMDKQGRIISDGAVVMERGRLIYVGDGDGLPSNAADGAEKVDGQGMTAMPGLINAHTHTAMSLFRGYANDLPLWEWLSERIWPLEDKMAARDAYWLSLLASAEMMAAGVTTFADMYMFMLETAQAVRDAGMRAVLARGLQGPDAHTGQRHREVEELAALQGSAEGRITTLLGPHAVYTCTPAYLQQVGAMAEHYGTGIHIHLSETQKEVADCINTHGKTPVKLLADLGLFKLPTLAAHCVHVTDEDLDILVSHTVKTVHCPASNMKLASGFAPLHRFLQRGLPVALGTDGAASNNNLSIFKEMGLAALMIKGHTGDPTMLPAEEALRMATIHGASALGLERVTGSLEEGKRADMILVDTCKPQYYPRSDIRSHLVYSGSGGDVHTVWIDGKMVYRNGRYAALDMEQICYEVEEIRKRIVN